MSLNTPFIYLLCCFDYTTLARRGVCEKGRFTNDKMRMGYEFANVNSLRSCTIWHYLPGTCLHLASVWHLENIINGNENPSIRILLITNESLHAWIDVRHASVAPFGTPIRKSLQRVPTTSQNWFPCKSMNEPVRHCHNSCPHSSYKTFDSLRFFALAWHPI